MISKELLSEELFDEIIGECCYDISIDGSDVWYNLNDTTRRSINIYELAHKCKEWLILVDKKDVSKDYAMTVCNTHNSFYTMFDGSKWYCGFAHIKTTYDNKAEIADITEGAKTEPEAIFKACQWILDNKDKQ